jgi:glycosyltransferase involved in cell wall biosynthesis
MKVMMLGLRGIPNVQGGIEKHVEELAPLLADRGCEVEVVARSPYMAHYAGQGYRGVRLTRAWAPRVKGAEAAVHTLIGVLLAAVRRPDILHLHAIGPAAMAPVARLLGLRVVVTHHGKDYDRQKWGVLARSILRVGEWAAARFANAVISVSQAVGSHLRERYAIGVEVIPNGVSRPEPAASSGALGRFGLVPGKYLLTVGRLVPEKRQTDVIRAFARAAPPGWRLAIVGAADTKSDYSDTVERMAREVPGVVWAGLQTGLSLRELYSNAGAFILASSHEGLPIVLLEALSFGLLCLASDIPANREVGLPPERYFPVGNIDLMARGMAAAAAAPRSPEDRDRTRDAVLARFSWTAAADKTLLVYRHVMERR